MFENQEICRQLERHQDALAVIEAEKRAYRAMGQDDLADRLEIQHAAYHRKRISDYQMLLEKAQEGARKE